MTKEIEEKIKKLLEGKNYDEILKTCDEIFKTDKKDDKVYCYKGKTYHDLGKYKEAIKDYDKAIKLNPEYSTAYNNRGASKSGLKRYKEAIKDYDEAIKVNPNNEKAYYNKGLAKAKLKLYKESIECYNKAIDLNPEYLIAYFNRYISQYNLKEYRKAIKDFEKLIEILKNIKLKKEEYNINIDFIVIMFIDIIRIVDIEYIFQLIKENNNELFVDEPTFKLLKNKIDINDISNNDDIFNNIKSILLYQYLLLKSLSFSNINDKNNHIEISYYTSIDTLLLLLNDKKERNKKDDEGNMRIINISNVNDPKERRKNIGKHF